MSTGLKVVAWLFGSATLIVVLVVGWVWWSLSGGWDGIRPAAQPDDRRVERAREDGAQPLGTLADPVEQAVTAAGTSLGRTELDGCYEGQNNWKTQDGFTLSCAQSRVVAATSAASTIDAAASELDDRLQDLGWRAASYGELTVAEGRYADGLYVHRDDPDAELTVEITAADGVRPQLWGRTGPFDDPATQAVLDEVEAATSIGVVVMVERTYFKDD